MAIAIGSPAPSNTREPNVAIVRSWAPVAIFIEIFVTHNIVRHVSCRLRTFIAAGSPIAPVVKVVRRAKVFHLGIQCICALESSSLSGVQRVGLPVAGRFPSSLANADHGVASVLTCFDPVSARLEDGERLVGCVDLKHIVAAQMANADVDRPRAELDLHGAVVEIEKGHSGIAVQVNDGRPQLELCAGVSVGPDLVARCQRAVVSSLHPLRLAGRLEGNRTLHVAQTCHAARRIILFLLLLRSHTYDQSGTNKSYREQHRYHPAHCVLKCFHL